MANYIFDNGTMTSVLDIMDSMNKAFKSACESVDSALSTVSSIASAGGDLGAEVGGTVLGNIRAANSSILEELNRANSLFNAFQQARDLLNRVQVHTGSSGSSHGGGGTSFADTGSLINTIAGMSTEEAGEYFVDTVGIVSEVVSAFEDDPIVETVMERAPDMAQALVDGSSIQDNILSDYGSRFSSGEIGVGEYFSGGLAAGTVNSVITIADSALNVIGIDIPTSLNQNISFAAGQVAEQAYRSFSTGIQSVWNMIT